MPKGLAIWVFALSDAGVYGFCFAMGEKFKVFMDGKMAVFLVRLCVKVYRFFA